MSRSKKPILIKVGKHLIDPHDVACISEISKKRDLFIVRLKSQPNMTYPIWASEEEVSPLIERFDIIEP